MFPYYYLYSLEKTCDLAGWEKIGSHDWYREGAEWLMKDQGKDGSWGIAVGMGKRVQDTAFAVLFLKRANRIILDIDTPGSWATGKPHADNDPVETGKKDKK